jgi:recombination protein RecR
MPQMLARPVADLIEVLSRLPGIGPKTASRLTFYLLRNQDGLAEALSEALLALRSGTMLCERCFNIAEQSPCAICADSGRDQGLICVVEEPLDVLAIERTGEYRGVYHVLHGALSPIDGIYPEKLRIAELITRVQPAKPREVILATNPSLEGENTAAYIYEQLAVLGVNVTRLARGLPVGGDLEYTDEVTLARALEGRRAMR